MHEFARLRDVPQRSPATPLVRLWPWDQGGVRVPPLEGAGPRTLLGTHGRLMASNVTTSLTFHAPESD